MTEQEFSRQVWRMYDQITTADGIKGKVLNVCFTTKSVRAYIGGSPEWIKCDMIETHITGKGGDADDATIIEELHNRVIKQADEIERLRNERQVLIDKLSKNQINGLLQAVHMMKQGLTEKKHKLEQVERGLEQINEIYNKVQEDGV